MDNFKLKLYKCFYTLNSDFFNNFRSNMDKRIIFQKYGLFFAKIFGLKVGEFSLYLHGPYNTSLANVGYEFYKERVQYNMEAEKLKFSDNATNIIDFIRQQLPLDNIDLLEIYCTYFYLLNERNILQEEAGQKVFDIKQALFEKNNINVQQIEFIHNEIRSHINTVTGETLVA